MINQQPLLRIEHFSKEYRIKAAKILKLLNKSKLIGYNEKLEMVYKNQPVKYSNIVQLIEHVLNENDTQKLQGLKRFYRVLRQLSVPNTLIKNKKGKILIKKATVK